MKRVPQSDPHPDAEALSAFMERALPDPERARIVAHMAGCDRCREIVFLARAAAEPEIPLPAAPIAQLGPGWFSGGFRKWRVALIPAAALASVGAIVLWVQTHPASPVSIAPSTPLASSDSELALRSAGQAASPAIAAPPATSPGGSNPNSKPDRPETKARRQILPAPPAAMAAQNSFADSAPIPGNPEPPAAPGSIHLDAHSAALARYVAPAVPGGPRAVVTLPPPAGVAEQQEDRAANVLPPTPGQGPTMAATAPASPAAPAPAPPNIIALHGNLAAATPASSQSAVQIRPAAELAPESINEFAMIRLASRTKLPSGLNTVSSAALLNRLVAVDSAGSVFLSEDGGRRWEPVAARWSGKAIAVQAPAQTAHSLMTAADAKNAAAAPQPPPSAATATAGEKAGPPPDTSTLHAGDDFQTDSRTAPTPGVLFRLLTDHHQVWVSGDGKVWRKQ